MPTIRTLKADAKKAGLELYYDTQWASWGLIDPECRVESLWVSPAQLRELTRQQFGLHYIAVMHQRINPEAGGEFPIATAQ